MRRVRSELDEVAYRLHELAGLVGVSEQELLAFLKVVSKADWANVEFRPIEGLEFEFESFAGGQIRLEITVRRGRTTVIREYDVPDLLVKGDISEVRLRPEVPPVGPPARRRKKGRGRRRGHRGGPAGFR